MTTKQFLPLTDLAVSKDEKDAEYRKRRHDYIEERHPAFYRDAKLSEGFAEVRVLKSGTAVFQKRKPKSQILEDRVWCVLYNLGYDELNVGQQFYLPPRGSEVDPRQIDVFGKDDETVVIVEAKTKEKLGSKNFSVVINDLARRKKHMMDAVRAHYGQKDFKLITLLATDGILWRPEDERLAEESQIYKLSERELKYFSEISRTLGRAAKYQFHAEFLRGQKIPAFRSLAYPAIKQSIGGKRAYVFTAPAREIIKVAFVNHRGLRDPQSAPSYQRLLSRKRLTKVSAFVDGGGYFANSILVSIPEGTKSGCHFDQKEKHVGSDIAFGILKLPETYKALRVIDGQHRLYGAAESDVYPDTTVVVVALVNIDMSEEAKLFKDINKEQKGVNPSLIGELEGEIDWNSPDPKKQIGAIAARAIDFIINDPHSVFGSSGQSLTVAELKKAIVNSGLIGQVRKDAQLKIGPLSGAHPEDTLDNLLGLMGWYFGMIREANPSIWEEGASGSKQGAPCSNVFVAGHLHFIADLARKFDADFGHQAELNPASLQRSIMPYLSAYCEHIGPLNYHSYMKEFKVPYGGRAVEDMKLKIAHKVSLKVSGFKIPGLEEYERATSQSRLTQVKQKVDLIAHASIQIAKQAIAEAFADSYWTDHVDPGHIEKLTRRRREEKSIRGSAPENYLAFTDLKEFLVGKQAVWSLLKTEFNIKLTSSAKGKTKHTKWMDEIARLSGQKDLSLISDSDFSLVEEVWHHFCKLESFASFLAHHSVSSSVEVLKTA